MARTKNTKKKKSLVNQVRNRTKNSPRPVKEELTLIPTPSTLLNCALCDDSMGGIAAGRMVNLIGDSSSGKTILALCIFAEMNMKSEFDDYEFIYDDAEVANSFDMKHLLGKETASRVQPPNWTEDEKGNEYPEPSEVIEDFHMNVLSALKKGKPFIYILDSFDALDSEADKKKVEQMRAAREKGNKGKQKGSYGIAKPRKSSELLRNIVNEIEKSKSILIIISQTRDNINPMSFERNTRSGGRALKFYATHEIWLSNIKTLKDTTYKTVIGHEVEAKVSKNKLTGKVRRVTFPIYDDYGIDDITSCINWLSEKGGWKKNKQTINAKDLKIKGTKKKIIEIIEKKGLEKKMRKAVGREWKQIEEEIRLNRKPRYRI